MTTVAQFIARVLVVSVACTLATYWFGWMSLPFVGFLWGIAERRGRAPGTVAAVGAVAAWICILGAAAARGADVREVAERMGAVMQLPGYIFAAMTLVFAALLCGTAAVIGATIGRYEI